MQSKMNKDIVLGLVRHILTAAGGYLVARGIMDDTQLTQAVGAIVTLVGVAWSIHSKRQPATPPPAPPNSIPRSPLILLLAASLSIALPTSTGCRTTNTAGRTLATITVTVDHAMRGWMHWVAMGRATLEQEHKVMRAYEKYQLAANAAQKAYSAAYAANDPGGMDAAIRALTAARDDLIALIHSFQRPPKK